MVEEVLRSIRTFRDAGVTVFLVEQNANLALRLADRAYVMETGAVTMTGTGASLLANEHVRESYLGAKSRARRETPGSLSLSDAAARD
jgi:branched-chain amino acid transport system ATP-binding protein